MTNKTVARTRVEMTHVIQPPHTNVHGTAFGGQIMAWIDVCAAVAAARHCQMPVVTASVDAIQFITPIKLGDVVILKGQVNAVFHTSMECGVGVYAENLITGEIVKAASAYATFVAIGAADGKPQKVPPLILENSEDVRRAKEANTRREQRLANRRGKT